MEKLVILHTNDLHSHFENWPKIRRFMLGTRAAEQAEGASVLAFDDGDAMDRSAPLTEATQGQINVQLLNEIGYDAATIGNNEGVGNPHDVLEHLYDHANWLIYSRLTAADRHGLNRLCERKRMLVHALRLSDSRRHFF